MLTVAQKAWHGAVATVGLPGLLFHDLRRSAVRNMERAGIPRAVAMAITGHKREDVYRRYNIVNDRDIQAAARKMEEAFNQPIAAIAATPSAKKPKQPS